MSDDEQKLERLRRKRMAQMMKRIDSQKKKEALEHQKIDKTGQFLKVLMQPSALNYYKTQIVPQRPRIAKRIVEVLQYLVSNNVLHSRLTQEELILIDRKLTGSGPSIKIKRSGKEYTDIASELRKGK